MNDFKFSRGPWKVRKSDSKDAYNVVGTRLGGKWKIARCPYTICDDNSVNERLMYQAKADAQLMSCAPEMLEMLKEAAAQIQYLQDKFQETGSGNAVLSRIDSLIEKATK